MKIDYECLAAVLGKHWSFITPEYMYYEMDDLEINKYLSLVPAEDLATLFGIKTKRPARKGGLKNLEDKGIIRKASR